MVKPALALSAAALASLMAFAAPSLAHANRLRVTSYELGPSAAQIELTGDAPLDEPWMKITGTTLRVWFPKVDKLGRFEQGDAEQAIRSVQLKTGAGATAVLSVELSAEHSVTKDDVELTRDGTKAMVRVALHGQEAGKAKSHAPSQQEQVAASPTAAAAAPAHDAAQPSTAVTTAAVAPILQAAAAAAPEYKGGTANTAAPLARKDGAEPKLLESGGGLSSLQLLALITLALAAVYAGLRLLLDKRGCTAVHPGIQVLGRKRLAPRHELMIVRALGQDHLLSLNGGRTERIVSAEAPLPSRASNAPASHTDPNEGVDPIGAGMAATLRNLRSRGVFKQPAASKPQASGADSSLFGAELLELVRKDPAVVTQTRGEPPQQASRMTESDAVAGLVRLRQRSS